MSSQRRAAIEAVAAVARALGEERGQVLFVGGTVTALYELDGVADIRPTCDVDCVVDVTTAFAYYAFIDRLRARGFSECTDDRAPLCRHICGDIRVDLMPAADTPIGPSNRWYPEALQHPVRYSFGGDLDANVIAPLYFVATKLEAFASRGAGDYRASHDLEDALAVIAGAANVRGNIASGARPVEQHLLRALVAFAGKDSFIDAVYGHFEGDEAGQLRAAQVVAWLRSLGT